MEAIAIIRLEAMAIRPSRLGSRPSLLGWRPLLLGWRSRPSLLACGFYKAVHFLFGAPFCLVLEWIGRLEMIGGMVEVHRGRLKSSRHYRKTGTVLSVYCHNIVSMVCPKIRLAVRLFLF